MAAPKKDFYNCAHCGRPMSAKSGDNGYVYIVKSDKMMHQISCPCGMLTKLCQTKGQLQEVWNSKPKKPFEAEKIILKYPPPRGAQKDDGNLGVHGENPF